MLRFNRDNWRNLYNILTRDMGVVVDNDIDSTFRLLCEAADKENYEICWYHTNHTNRIRINWYMRHVKPIINYSNTFQYSTCIYPFSFVQLLDYDDRAITSILCTGNGTVEIAGLYTKTVEGCTEILNCHLEFIFGCDLNVQGNIQIIATYSEIFNKTDINAVAVYNTRHYPYNVVLISNYYGRYYYVMRFG